MVLSTLLLPLKVLAVDLDFFSANDILFYMPCEVPTSSDNSSAGAASNGTIVLIGDSISVGLQNVGIAKKLKDNGYTDVTIDAAGSRSMLSPGDSTTNGLQAVDANKDKISSAGTIVVGLGTNTEPEFESNLKKMVKKIRNINNNIRIFWTNVGVTNTGAKASMDEYNKIIDRNKSALDYTVIDWHKEVIDNPSLIPIPDGIHPGANGYNKLAALVTKSVGKAGAISSSGGAPMDGTGNIPYDLPATSGKTGLESAIDENGKFIHSSEKVTFSSLAKKGQAYRDYYITMRWNYVSWNWDGTTADADNEQYAWMARTPRMVLVTNERTGKSIYAAALEAGPAPWAGAASGTSGASRNGWHNPQRGTPSEYTGRVSGFPPKAFSALGARQGMSSGSGDVLKYQWAPNQNATPGPTTDKVGSSNTQAVSSNPNCGCASSSSPSASTNGKFDKYLKALAYTESGGSYTVVNSSGFEGRYQIGPNYFNSYADNYPPGKQLGPHAATMPGDVQDAMVYLHLYEQYLKVDKDTLRLAAGWIWPAAADSPNDPAMDIVLPGNNGGLTPRKYAQIVLGNMKKSAAQKLELKYLDAPEFEKYYKKLDGNKNTPYGAFPGGGSSASTAGSSTGNGNANNAVSGASTGTKPKILISPGHTGQTDTKMMGNPAIIDHISPNPTEMQNVWDVAVIVKRKLEAKGYEVLMTKNSANGGIFSWDRAQMANDNNVDLAFEIHTDTGATYNHDWKVGEVWSQWKDGYREAGRNGNGQKVKLVASDAVMAKSQEYAKKVATARQEAGQTGVKGVVGTGKFGTRPAKPFDSSYPTPAGNIPLVMLWSKVPWIYNEVGGASGGLTDQQIQVYAEGLVNGVVESVPPGSGGSTSSECGNTSGDGDATAIVETAIKYSWDSLGAVHGCTPQDAYKEPWKKLYSGYSGACGNPDYSPCNQFVGTVMRSSAADNKFEPNVVSSQARYMESHPEKYTKIPNPQSTRDLEPGDILVKKDESHIMIYVGDKPGGDIRNGSLGKYAPAAASTGWYMGDIKAYRLK